LGVFVLFALLVDCSFGVFEVKIEI